MEDNVYDVSIDMVGKLKKLPARIRFSIADQIELNSSQFIELEGYTQTIGGVVKGDPPYFFEIEYVREPDKAVVILDMDEITLDEYLDYIDEKKIFKSNGKETDYGIDDII